MLADDPPRAAVKRVASSIRVPGGIGVKVHPGAADDQKVPACKARKVGHQTPCLWRGAPGFDLGMLVADLGAGGDLGGADFPPGVALGGPAFIGVDLHDDDAGLARRPWRA